MQLAARGRSAADVSFEDDPGRSGRHPTGIASSPDPSGSAFIIRGSIYNSDPDSEGLGKQRYTTVSFKCFMLKEKKNNVTFFLLASFNSGQGIGFLSEFAKFLDENPN